MVVPLAVVCEVQMEKLQPAFIRHLNKIRSLNVPVSLLSYPFLPLYYTFTHSFTYFCKIYKHIFNINVIFIMTVNKYDI